jgi:multiple sugar transport system substrate-binding protein
MALVVLLSACSGGGGGAGGSRASASTVSQSAIDEALKKPTTLTFWTWLPDIQKNIDLFEKAYPAIKVKVENVGNGTVEFTKIRSAVKAGTGAPDVVQLSTSFVSSFVATDSLLDLAPYGAMDLKNDYLPGMWNQIADDQRVWAIPQDWGPVGLLYRDDLLKAAGIARPPATWDEFKAAATAMKSKTGAYIVNFAPDPEIQVLPVLRQAGVKPFSYDGKTTIGVNLNSSEAKQALAYWQELIQSNLVSVDPDFTDQWYQGLAKGKYASWISAAWGPIFLQGTAKGTAGKWRASELPKWAASDTATVDAGGSSNAVLKTTKNPIAAYELAKWINNDKSSTLLFATQESLFPVAVDVLQDPQFTGQTSPFFGGQKINSLFGQIASNVGPSQWLPIMDYVDSSFNDTLGKAIASRGDLSAGLDAWQAAIVAYAKKQGFTVS